MAETTVMILDTLVGSAWRENTAKEKLTWIRTPDELIVASVQQFGYRTKDWWWAAYRRPFDRTEQLSDNDIVRTACQGHMLPKKQAACLFPQVDASHYRG